MTPYIVELKRVLSKVKCRDLKSIAKWMGGFERIFVIGNGGSLATAEHFVVDLNKNTCKMAFSVGSTSLITMAGNDYGFEHSFDWMLKKCVGEKDLVFAISTSGQSLNILRALTRFTGKTLLLTGLGGRDADGLVDKLIIIDSKQTQILEDVSLTICHLIALQMGGKKWERFPS